MSAKNPPPELPNVVALRPPRRLPLAAIELGKSAADKLQALIIASMIGAMLTCAAQFIPWSNHEGRVEYGVEHGGIVILLSAAIIFTLAIRAWLRLRHGRIAAWSIAGTLLSLVIGFAGVFIWLSSYFDHVEAASAEPLHKIGSIILLVATLFGMAIGLPAFHQARRAREAAEKQALPRARALE